MTPDPLLPRPDGRRTRASNSAHEWKIVSVRETVPGMLPECVQPEDATTYWRQHIATASMFNPEVECFAVLLLNTKNRIRGHHVVSVGSMNETISHPREVFRAAVIASAFAVVLMHNHPSGDPAPSETDRRTTSRLVGAGSLLSIRVLDHVIVGSGSYFSFREAGLV